MKIVGARWREFLLRYAPVFLWVGVVLFLSSPQGSMSRTSLFVRPLLEFLFPAADEATLQIYHGYVRKAAHLTEYAILAILAARAFASELKPILKNRWVTCSVLLVLFVASVDEFNQSFEASRTGTPWDVALDMLGGIFGSLIFVAFRYLRGRRPRHESDPE